MKLCCIAVFVAWVLVISVVFIKEPAKECYKQTTDSKTMLHRIKCEG